MKVIKALNGDCDTLLLEAYPIIGAIKALLSNFVFITFDWVSRAFNEMVHQLCRWGIERFLCTKINFESHPDLVSSCDTNLAFIFLY